MASRLLKVPPNTAVTAAPQAVVFNQGDTYTLRNTDTTNSLYYLHDPGTYVQDNTTGFAGLAAALKSAGGSELKAGEEVVIKRAPPWVMVVCATTLTATLQVDAGDVHAAIGVSAITKAMLAESSLYEDRIPLSACMQQDGAPMTVGGGAGHFSIDWTPEAAENCSLLGEDAGGTTKTDVLVFEYVIPAEYKDPQDLKVVTNWKYITDGTVTAKSLDLLLFKLGEDSVPGADICATTIRTLTTSPADYTFTITPATLAPGDVIIGVFAASMTETAGGGKFLNAVALSLRIQLDRTV
ncbi:hypothetical protein LCGC14_2746940 [marine sediment metagenome]|uniref:Uncharacterized protein n=1 Tax=marine sediment metagenome TaxID=412755 RepID=A0A0F8Z2S8_9ZZZZ